MYHIPNDKRAITSATNIYKSLRNVLLNKDLKDITVTDIYKDSHISRSTFYRLFDNVVDVLEYQLSIFIDEYLENLKNEPDSLYYFYYYFNMHSDLIYIIKSQNEAIISRIMNKKMGVKINSNDPYIDYLISFKVGIMTSLLSKWVERGKRESVEEITKITKRLVSYNTEDILTKL